MQGTLHDWTRDGENNQRSKTPNLSRYGDDMPARFEGDGILRLCNLNKRGINMGKGLEVSPDVEIIKELGINAQGYCEVNKPWSKGNKARFDKMMETVFEGKYTPTVYSSRPTEYDVKYQQGGCLLTINGDCAGRHQKSGSDPLGRYCWMKLNCCRDE